jgi:hypothetical protein
MRCRVWLLVLLLAACSKVSEENFAKVEEGMTEEQVMAILGKPAEANSVSVLGVSGTTSRWAGNGATITIRFINGKVALKSFEKPPPQ